MITYGVAALAIFAGYLIGKTLAGWKARVALVSLVIVPYILWSSPLWRQLAGAEREDAGMAIAFLILLLFPYAAYVAVLLAAYMFGKSNKIDMIS